HARAVGVRVTPPGPDVPGAVGDDVQAERSGGAGEPLAQRRVLGRPGEPAVAARRRPTDRLDLGPPPLEAAHLPTVGCTGMSEERALAALDAAGIEYR